MRELFDLWDYFVASVHGILDILRLLGLLFGGR